MVSDALRNLDAFGFQRRDLVRIVGEQPHFLDAECTKDCRGVGVVPLIVGEAEPKVGIDGVQPAIL